MTVSPANTRIATLMFILPVTVVMLYIILSKVVDVKKRTVCKDCYGGMEYDLIAVLVSIVYLVMYRYSVSNSQRYIAFYLALVMSVFMLVKLVRVFIAKIRSMTGQTPKTLGAEAAVKVAVDSAKDATTPSKAKAEGAKAGAKAATEAAISAGLSDAEVLEAAVAGKEMGEVVAEKASKMM